MEREEHAVRIAHGNGDSPLVRLDDFVLQGVKSYSVQGESGKRPIVTVTIEAHSIVFHEEKKEREVV